MKILLLGVRSEHLNLIRLKYPSIKFKAVTDQKKIRPRDINLGFDFIISNYKFTNHSTENYCKSHTGYMRASSYTHIQQLIGDIISCQT